MTERLHFHFSLSCIEEGNGNPLHCSCLENLRDGEAWWAAVYGVTQSQTRLSDFTFPFHFHALEKEMATNSSVLGLENLRDGEAWWAAVYGVAQSWTRLKQLSSSSRTLSNMEFCTHYVTGHLPITICSLHLEFQMSSWP